MSYFCLISMTKSNELLIIPVLDLLTVPNSLTATHDIIHSHVSYHYDTYYDNYWLRITTWSTHTTRTSSLIGQKAVWLVSVCPWIVWFDWLQSFTPVEVDICMWGKGWNVHCPNSFPFFGCNDTGRTSCWWFVDMWNIRFRNFETHPDILSY